MWILSRTVADSVQKTRSQGRLYIALNGGFRYREEGNLYGQLHVGEPALGCHLVVNGKMNSDNNYPDMWWRVVGLVTLTTTVTKFVDFCNFHRLVTCSTLFDSKFCHLGAVFWMWKLKALLTLTSKDTVEKRSVSSDGCENVKVQEVRNDKKISVIALVREAEPAANNNIFVCFLLPYYQEFSRGRVVKDVNSRFLINEDEQQASRKVVG